MSHMFATALMAVRVYLKKRICPSSMRTVVGTCVMKFGFICPERVKHMANFISFDS